MLSSAMCSAADGGGNGFTIPPMGEIGQAENGVYSQQFTEDSFETQWFYCELTTVNCELV
jgi:hypothetical protein